MLDKTRFAVHGKSTLPVKLSSASLTGGTFLPVKFAEAFGFGRAKKIIGGRQDA